MSKTTGNRIDRPALKRLLIGHPNSLIVKARFLLVCIVGAGVVACRKPPPPAPAPELAPSPSVTPPPQVAPAPVTPAPEAASAPSTANTPKGNRTLTYVPPSPSLLASQPKPVNDSPKAAPRGRGGAESSGSSGGSAPAPARKVATPQQPIDLQALTRAVEAFQQKFGLLPDSINALAAAGLVRSVPPPPAGYQYVIDENTREVKLSKQ